MEDFKKELEWLTLIHPNWKTIAYSQIDFNKGIKNKDVKNAMQFLRAYFSKHSGKQSGCFCHRGLVIIINWLIERTKRDKKEEEINGIV